MGGGLQLVKNNEDIQRVAEQSEIVNLCVIPSIGCNQFDINKLNKLFSDEIKIILDRYGIKHKVLQPGGRGGGGGSTLWELIGNLLKIKDFIGLFLLLLRIIFQIPYIILSRIGNIYNNNQPRMDLSMRIIVNSDFDDEINTHIENVLKNRLITTKILSDYLCEYLSKKHPLFKFNQDISLDIKVKEFTISFNIPQEYLTKFNNLRIMRIINDFNIKNKLKSYYYINSKVFILRRDIPGDYKGSIKDYYLFLSSKLLKDYFK